MKKSFPNEWLLIIDFDTDESGHLIAGIVHKHSPDMNIVATPPVLHQDTAFRYTGESTFMGLRSHAENSNNI